MSHFPKVKASTKEFAHFLKHFPRIKCHNVFDHLCPDSGPTCILAYIVKWICRGFHGIAHLSKLFFCIQSLRHFLELLWGFQVGINGIYAIKCLACVS